MMRTIRMLVCCLAVGFMLAACDSPATELPTPPTPETSEIEVTPPAATQPDSPLAMDSPLVAPRVQPLPTNYARPAAPHLLFLSVEEGERSWNLLNLADGSTSPVALDNLAGYTVDNLNWESHLSLFIAQLTDEATGHANLYLLDIEGAIVAQLTYDEYEGGNAQYSPANGMFVYVCLIQDLDICLTAPNDAGLLNLTQLNTREANPHWSPDGESIVFTSNAQGIVNVWAMNADGSNRRNLSAVGLGDILREEGDARWSPDGSTILFRSFADDNAELYLMDPDGENRRNLTNNPANDTSPRWSPDGNSIAFRSDRDEGQDIYVLDLASGEVVNVTNTPDIRENNFVWSGDSTEIYFDAQTDGVFDIFAVNRDGSDLRNLTDSPTDALDPQWVE